MDDWVDELLERNRHDELAFPPGMLSALAQRPLDAWRDPPLDDLPESAPPTDDDGMEM